MTDQRRRDATFIASMVSSFGARGSNSNAFSSAIRTIIGPKASDTVRPMERAPKEIQTLYAYCGF